MSDRNNNNQGLPNRRNNNTNRTRNRNNTENQAVPLARTITGFHYVPGFAQESNSQQNIHAPSVPQNEASPPVQPSPWIWTRSNGQPIFPAPAPAQRANNQENIQPPPQNMPFGPQNTTWRPFTNLPRFVGYNNGEVALARTITGFHYVPPSLQEEGPAIPVREGAELQMNRNSLGSNAIDLEEFNDGEAVEVVYTADQVERLNRGENVRVTPSMVLKQTSVEQLIKSGAIRNPSTREPIALRERRILRLRNSANRSQQSRPANRRASRKTRRGRKNRRT